MGIGFVVFDKIFKNVKGTGKTVLATIALAMGVSTVGIATGFYDIGAWLPSITAILFGLFLIVEGTLKLAVPQGFKQLIALVSGLVGLVAVIAAVLGMFGIAAPMLIAQVASVAMFFVIVQFFV